VAQTLLSPDTYLLALEELERLCGDSYLVAKMYVEELDSLPSVKENDDEGLYNFHNKLHCIVATLSASGYDYELRSAATLTRLTAKVPKSVQSRWIEKIFDMKPAHPTIEDFDRWLERIAIRWRYQQRYDQDVVTKEFSMNNPEKKWTKEKLSPTVNATQRSEELKQRKREQPEEPRRNSCRICNKKWHLRSACTKFLAAQPTERAEIIMKDGGCFKCVDGNHLRSSCRLGITCTIEGCKLKDHTLLHGAAGVQKKKTEEYTGVYYRGMRSPLSI